MKKTKPVEDIKVVAGGKEFKLDEPSVLGTPPIKLTRMKPIRAVNLYLPPGVSKFYVERLNKNNIRFLIRTDEVERLADKAQEMMGKKKKKAKKAIEALKDDTPEKTIN